MNATVQQLKNADQDFEWYPTTQEMIDAVARTIQYDKVESILDIGAGDGRVLESLGENIKELYAIEKSSILMKQLPVGIIPMGTDFIAQDLSAINVDVIFCNPPYSEFDQWASRIIREGYAKTAFLVIPKRWKDSPLINDAINQRGVKTRVIYSGDFLNAERQARASIDVVEITYPRTYGYGGGKIDPFDVWFDQNIDVFDETKDVEEPEAESFLVRMKNADTLTELVSLYNLERDIMQENYQAIFKLDRELLKELGVEKESVRDGIKKKISDLKGKYWQALFDRMTMLTDRLSSKTRQKFLDKINARSVIEFTYDNAHAVALWAVKNANQYYDEQLVDLFKALSSPENISNYASNKKTWEKEGWRFRNSGHSHYKLDYRIVVDGYRAIYTDSAYTWEYQGGLHETAHKLIGDICAVMNNLGWKHVGLPSTEREWESGKWQDFTDFQGKVIFQVKAFKKGTVHIRFRQYCIARLNVEAGRLMKWLKCEDVDSEVGENLSHHYGANFNFDGSTNLLECA